MNENDKTGCSIALVGASSLKGKELKQVLQEYHLPVSRLALLDAEEAGGQLTEFDEEPAIIQPISKENFEDVRLAIFASSLAFTREHWEMAESSGCDIIDLSYFLESHPRARLRAPAVEKLRSNGTPAVCRNDAGSRIAVPAHPVAIALVAILGNLARCSPVQRSVVTVYEPVSEHGQAGVDELHQQTVKLLSFQKIPRAVFDSQVAFNMLSRYGAESRPTLQEAQQRVCGHIKALLPAGIGQPALRLIHAPIFYGHSFSCFVELKEPVAIEAIEETLDRKPLTLNRDPDVPPSVVSVAGCEDIILGRVEKDAAVESGYWFWGVLDNLRLAAINTIQIAEALLSEDAGSHRQAES